ncbi:MAG: hypothetical protein J5850_04175, partial [Clostridia bacterium]|nr:hypothetical protein [Clostridia bacterium]
MNNITLEEIAESITRSEELILLSHTSPDGDTIGSVQGLALGLESIGKKVTCLCDSDVPSYLNFIIFHEYKRETNPGNALVISVDVASEQMLGKL